MSVPICNRFHATRDNCGKITTSQGGVAVFHARLRRPRWTYRVGTWTAEIYVYCSKFHMQVVLVYIRLFGRNSVLKCALRLKIAKNLLKILFLWWGVKVVQNHRCW